MDIKAAQFLQDKYHERLRASVRGDGWRERVYIIMKKRINGSHLFLTYGGSNYVFQG